MEELNFQIVFALFLLLTHYLHEKIDVLTTICYYEAVLTGCITDLAGPFVDLIVSSFVSSVRFHNLKIVKMQTNPNWCLKSMHLRAEVT